MKRLIFILCACAALVACGGKGDSAMMAHPGKHAAEAYSQQDYAEGYRLAGEMLSTCVDSVDVQLWLLEFHAKCSEGSKERASDMRFGFQDALEERDPEMAARLFN